MRAVTIIAVVAVAGAIALGLFSAQRVSIPREVAPSMEVNQLFEDWMVQHQKSYASPEEKNYRRSVFAQTLANIAEYNKMYSHRSAVNKFSDLTFEEFLAQSTGYRISPEKAALKATMKPSSQQDFLTQTPSLDWRTKGIVNPVKDQGKCGSCWAFSATSSIESAWAQAGNPLVQLSEQQMVDCSRSYGNLGCNGGYEDRAFLYIKTVGGQELSSDYPYTASNGKCSFDKSKIKASIVGYQVLPQQDCAGLMTSATQQPVSVGVAVTQPFQSYSSGVFSITNCGLDINHAVNVEGYGTDSTTNQNFWLVRNSWGTSWGEQGYIRMNRAVQLPDGICGICDDVSFPSVKK